MKNLQNYCLQELTNNELNDIYGGGILEDFLYKAGKKIGSAIGSVKNCIDSISNYQIVGVPTVDGVFGGRPANYSEF